MIFSKQLYKHMAIVALALSLGVLRTVACSVPVFRYALERDSWEPAHYGVFVFYQDKLSPQAEEAVKILQAAQNRFTILPAKEAPNNNPANLNLTLIDVSKPLTNKRLALLWQMAQPLKLPAIVVTLPPSPKRKTPQPIWRGPATRESAEALLNSPARRAIVNALAKGHAAVWLVVDGPDPQQNRKIKEFIQRESRHFAANFKINPEALEVLQKETNGKFKLKFAVVNMNPRDPQEKLFYAILRAMDPTIKNVKEPLAFPVFGRGRMLPPIPQSKLTTNLVDYVSEYLAGDCSCEIKWQNPGTDGLFSANWYKVLAGVSPYQTTTNTIDAATKPISAQTAVSNHLDKSSVSSPQPVAVASRQSLTQRMATLFAILILIAGGATVIIMRGRYGCCRQ